MEQEKYLMIMRKNLKTKYDSIPCDPKYQLKSLFYFAKSQLLLEKLVVSCSKTLFNSTQTNTLILNPQNSIEKLSEDDFFSENSDCNKIQDLPNEYSDFNSNSDSLLGELNEKFFTEDVLKKIDDDGRISYSSTCFNVYEPDLSSAKSSERSEIFKEDEKFSFPKKITDQLKSSTSLKSILKSKKLKTVTGIFSDLNLERVSKAKTLNTNKSEFLLDKKKLNSFTKPKSSSRKFDPKERSPISTQKFKRPNSKYKSQKSQTLATSSLYKSQSKSPLKSSLAEKIDHLKNVLKGKCKPNNGNSERQGSCKRKRPKSKH